MAQEPQKGDQSKKERTPVVLSKDEALYAPSKRAQSGGCGARMRPPLKASGAQ